MKKIALSEILRFLDSLDIHPDSYLYGTFLDYCGLPNARSLFDKETGLIRANFRNSQGDISYYEPGMLLLLKRMKIKYVQFRVGKGAVDSRIMITSAIEADIKEI